MKNLKEENLGEKMKPMLIFFMFAIIAMACQFFLRKKIAEEGIVIKCTLIKSEGYKGGKLLTIQYMFNGKSYDEVVHGGLGKNAVGTQYFMKLLPDKPAAPLLLEDYPVPDCLETSPSPPEGWKDIPLCNK